MRIVKLGDHIKQVRGVSYQSGDAIESPKEGYIPILRSNNIEEGAINIEGLIYVPEDLVKDHQKLKAGDLLLTASTGSKKVIGKNGASPKNLDASFGAFCKVIRAKETIDRVYLKHFLQTPYYRRTIQDVVNGANINNIKTEHINDLKIPLPPLATQKKIATILDVADAHRQKTRKLLNKYDELAQSIFLEMFGDPVTNPKGWEVKRLGEVCEKITDGTHHSPESKTEGAPYVTAKHVKPFKLNFLSKPTYISWQDHQEIYKRCSPKKGDVLYIKDGATTGIACINTFEEEISLLSSLALIQTNRHLLNPDFLCFWLNYESMKARLLSIWMSGAAIQRYTLKKIKSFEIMIPPIEMQERFSLIINENEKSKLLINKEIKESENLFNSLLQKAFKGEMLK